MLACDDDPSFAIGEVFSITGPGALSAPTFGPENRVVLATRISPGRVATVDADTGSSVDPVFDAFPTLQRPAVLEREVVLLTPVGRLAFYGLNGTETNSVPPSGSPPLGIASAPAPAPGQTLRIATTSGRVLGYGADGTQQFDTPLVGAAVDSVAVAPDGACFVATDAGRLFGVGSDGLVFLDQQLSVPITAPAVSLGDVVAVVTGSLLQGFSRDGTVRFSADVGFARGVVASSEGALLAWNTNGDLRLVDRSGRSIANLSLGDSLAFAPAALPDGRFAVVTDSGLARTIDSNGAILAEGGLEGGPTAELLADRLGRVYVASGDRLLALNFVFEL